MPRMLDVECRKCGIRVIDMFVMSRPRVIRCESCGGICDEVLLPRHARNASRLSGDELTLAFRRADGTYSIPCRNDAPTPPGCERIELRSLREVDAFERRSGLVSERAHFDRGSGRAHDDALPTPASHIPVAERRRRFLAAWER